jgi:hypothetical protein
MEHVREYLKLDSTSPTGLVWVKSPGKKCHVGTPAFTAIAVQGYRVGRLKGKLLRAHRVIWYLAYGTIPEVIDHIDGDRLNYNLSNLRDVTCIQNSHNMSKAKGYTFNKRAGKWQAQLTVNYQHMVIGLYNTAEEARAAYLAAKKIHHPTSPINKET